jgi:hypothetical protein
MSSSPRELAAPLYPLAGRGRGPGATVGEHLVVLDPAAGGTRAGRSFSHPALPSDIKRVGRDHLPRLRQSRTGQSRAGCRGYSGRTAISAHPRETTERVKAANCRLNRRVCTTYSPARVLRGRTSWQTRNRSDRPAKPKSPSRRRKAPKSGRRAKGRQRKPEDRFAGAPQDASAVPRNREISSVAWPNGVRATATPAGKAERRREGKARSSMTKTPRSSARRISRP